MGMPAAARPTNLMLRGDGRGRAGKGEDRVEWVQDCLSGHLTVQDRWARHHALLVLGVGHFANGGRHGIVLLVVRLGCNTVAALRLVVHLAGVRGSEGVDDGTWETTHRLDLGPLALTRPHTPIHTPPSG